MNDIKKLILQKENRKLEFKQKLPSNDKIIKTSIEREKRNISFDSLVNFDLKYESSIFDNIINKIEDKLNLKPTIINLEKLKLIKEEHGIYYLTNLGVWFSIKRDDYFPLLKVECARFKGNNTKVFLDQVTYGGNIIDSIEQTMDFIKRNIKLGATIGEIYRKNRWEYPLLALREVIINAIVHRDYSILGSDIKIAIFDDMIEITNPGNLIIDKDKLGLGYSELRNQNLGNLFKKLELIEQWGTGYEKIMQEIQEYPEIALEIDDDSTFIQVKFMKSVSLTTIQETAQETAHKSTKEQIITLLSNNPKTTKQDLMKILNKADGTIKQHLYELKKDGMIKRIGSTKSGYWEIVK